MIAHCEIVIAHLHIIHLTLKYLSMQGTFYHIGQINLCYTTIKQLQLQTKNTSGIQIK